MLSLQYEQRVTSRGIRLRCVSLVRPSTSVVPRDPIHSTPPADI
jgi:hypothetical protein